MMRKQSTISFDISSYWDEDSRPVRLPLPHARHSTLQGRRPQPEGRRARRDSLKAELLGEKEAGETFNERKERHKTGR